MPVTTQNSTRSRNPIAGRVADSARPAAATASVLVEIGYLPNVDGWVDQIHHRSVVAKPGDVRRGFAVHRQLGEDAPDHRRELVRVAGTDCDARTVVTRQRIEYEVAVGRHRVQAGLDVVHGAERIGQVALEKAHD